MRSHEQQAEHHARGRRNAARPARDVLSGPMSPAAVLGLQRLAGNTAVARLCADAAVQRATVQQALASAGRPLDGGVRAEMEGRLGADFSDVRVHTDATAHAAAESVRAQAFTSGSHIVFRRGRYDTTSHAGKHMLAHELTHVTQQRSGPVAGTETADGLAVSDPSDAFERAAEANADRAMSGPAGPVAQRATAAAPAPGVAVQRSIGFEMEIPMTTTYGFAPGIKPAELAGTKQIVNPVTSTTWIPRRDDRPWWRPQIDPPSMARRLRKAERMVEIPGLLTVEADDALNGASDLEFVTVPFPETADGRARLVEAITAMVAMASRLDGSMRTAADLAAGVPGAVAQTLAPPARQNAAEYVAWGFAVDGAPQVTAGIPLGRVEALYNALSAAHGHRTDKDPAKRAEAKDIGGQDFVQGTIAAAAANVRALADQRAAAGEPLSAGLRGMLELIAGYLINGRSGGQQYFKGIAPIMARTDLASVFALLSAEERARLGAENGDPFVALALAAAGMGQADLAGPVLPDVSGDTPAQRVGFAEVTRQVWLRGITRGRDVLSQAGYAAQFPATAGKAEHFESMGSLGARTDAVAGGQAPIVELRRLGRNLPLAAWGAALLGVFDMITAISTSQRDDVRYRRAEQDQPAESAD